MSTYLSKSAEASANCYRKYVNDCNNGNFPHSVESRCNTQYEFSNGHALYHENVPTRTPLYSEILDAFTKQDSQVYHVVNRVRNTKGETTHIVYTPLARATEKSGIFKTLVKLLVKL